MAVTHHQKLNLAVAFKAVLTRTWLPLCFVVAITSCSTTDEAEQRLYSDIQGSWLKKGDPNALLQIRQRDFVVFSSAISQNLTHYSLRYGGKPFYFWYGFRTGYHEGQIVVTLRDDPQGAAAQDLIRCTVTKELLSLSANGVPKALSGSYVRVPDQLVTELDVAK